MNVDIVIPCFNDARSLVELIRQTDQLLNENDYYINRLNYLVIDNASDVPIILDISAIPSSARRKITIYRLGVNVGYGGAILFGIKQSTADLCGVIDSDLEDPPRDLLDMAQLLIDTNADCVYGVRIKRDTSLRLKFFYSIFYRIYSKISDNKIHKNAGEFAIYNNKIVRRIAEYNLNDSFVRGVRTLVGGKQIPYNYSRQKRYLGHTKFKFYTSFDLAIDGFLFNSKKPLRFVTFTGIFIYTATGFLLLINIILKIINTIFDESYKYVLPEGLTQTSIIIYVLLLTIFTVVAILGEYVLKILKNTQMRPPYFLEKIDEIE
jgi:dolichol-phosphate mannosyltransferase